MYIKNLRSPQQKYTVRKSYWYWYWDLRVLLIKEAKKYERVKTFSNNARASVNKYFRRWGPLYRKGQKWRLWVLELFRSSFPVSWPSHSERSSVCGGLRHEILQQLQRKETPVERGCKYLRLLKWHAYTYFGFPLILSFFFCFSLNFHTFTYPVSFEMPEWYNRVYTP